jgi:hypothetical protein
MIRSLKQLVEVLQKFRVNFTTGWWIKVFKVYCLANLEN